MEFFKESGGAKKHKVKPGSFQGLGLSQNTFKAIKKMGYNMPTPIQRKTIPTILDGSDVVAMARTGSGKTAAFIIPIIERLSSHSVSVGLRAAALSPTRELAMQTAKFFRQLGRFCDLRCCLLVGGQAMEAQFEHLANNPDIVIATPGRLMHHILEAELSLQRVEVLVIDEADRLFELGFAEQLQKCLDSTPPARQVLLFSATLPAQLVSFSRVGLKDPVFVRLDVETTLSESLDLWYLYCRKDEKMAAAVSVLRRFHLQKKSTIVFVATRHHVEFFGDLLTRLGLPVSIVYGSMDQQARESNIHRFRVKKANIMVTTDVAARGIDIPLLDNVLNYDFPPSGKLFVHRAGRTARAGRSGLAVSLVSLDDLPYMVELMLFLGQKPRVADGKEAAPSNGSKAPPLLGAVPSLQSETETLLQLLEDEGSDLQALYKSMISSYKLYYKSRPSASKSSVIRSKQLMEECGGPARMQSLIHPAFVDKASGGPKATGITTADFIQELRSFRPKAEKVGNAVSTSNCRNMEMAKQDATAVSAVSALAGDLKDTVVEKTAPKKVADAKPTNNTKGRGEKRKKGAKAVKGAFGAAAEDDFDGFEVSVDGVKLGSGAASSAGAAEEAPDDKPRTSKRARGKAKAKAEDYSGFDVRVDGVQVGAGANTKAVGSTAASAEKAAENAPPAQQFFLSTERSTQMEDYKEAGLDMERYQMDLMPDDGKDIKKATSVIRWDAKKKKYLPIMVSVDGRAIRKTKHKNEAGVMVDGEAKKSTIYAKWARTAKRRIQKIGEMENTYSKPASRRPGAEQEAEKKRRAAADTVVFENTGRYSKEGDDPDKGRKPIVPYHGKIAEQFLTHKQKRMVKKRGKKDSIVEGEASQELKSLEMIKRDKMNRDRKKLSQRPDFRKKKGRDKKEERMKRNEQISMQGARSKSLMLTFEGSKVKRKKASQRRGMPTI